HGERECDGGESEQPGANTPGKPWFRIGHRPKPLPMGSSGGARGRTWRPHSPHCCDTTLQSATAYAVRPASSVKTKRPDLAMQLAVHAAAGARPLVPGHAW